MDLDNLNSIWQMYIGYHHSYSWMSSFLFGFNLIRAYMVYPALGEQNLYCVEPTYPNPRAPQRRKIHSTKSLITCTEWEFGKFGMFFHCSITLSERIYIYNTNIYIYTRILYMRSYSIHMSVYMPGACFCQFCFISFLASIRLTESRRSHSCFTTYIQQKHETFRTISHHTARKQRGKEKIGRSERERKA